LQCPRRSSAFPTTFGQAFFLQQRKLNLLLDGIDAIDENADLVTEAEGAAGVLSDDFARVLVEGVAVVDQGCERDEAFDEEICEFDEEAELGHADDQAVEVFADSVLHEFGFLPFHQFALGLVGAPLGLTGFLGDGVKVFERDGAVL